MSQKAIINLKNKDNECFKWAVTRAVHPVDRNAERITKELREQAETLNWEGINFPTHLNDITKFEKPNRSISVNVFDYEGGVYPLRISEQPEGTNHVDLFLIANEEGMQHYCWIKSMSRLLSSQKSKHNGMVNNSTVEDVLIHSDLKVLLKNMLNIAQTMKQ